MGMKSIEERAKEYADKHKREIYSWDDLCQYRATQQAQLAAYTKGAEDQKTIDIDKACEWVNTQRISREQNAVLVKNSSLDQGSYYSCLA